VRGHVTIPLAVVLLAGCFESHTLDLPGICPDEPDAALPDINDCDPRPRGTAFEEFEVCLPAQVNVDEAFTRLRRFVARGRLRCGFQNASCITSYSGRGRSVFTSFNPRECPTREGQCLGCSHTNGQARCNLLPSFANPGDPLRRGVHTLTINGYDGQLDFLITRDETLSTENCATFTPSL